MGKVKNIRSSVEGKIPTAEQLELGQIALNLNPNSPTLAFKTNDDNVVTITPNKEWVGTQAEYEALPSIDPTVTYYITE